jgi:hypothetical protein
MSQHPPWRIHLYDPASRASRSHAPRITTCHSDGLPSSSYSREQYVPQHDMPFRAVFDEVILFMAESDDVESTYKEAVLQWASDRAMRMY